RVRYLEVRAEGGDHQFDRVVFPALDESPEGIFPRLDGRRSLIRVLREMTAGAPLGSPRYQQLARQLQQQVLLTAFRGWLAEAEGANAAGADGDVPAALPAPILETMEEELRGVRIAAVVDPLAQMVEITCPADQGVAPIQVMAPAVAPRGLVFARAGSAAFAYRGGEAALTARTRSVIAALLAAFRRWETRAPAAAASWWDAGAVRLAGATLALGNGHWA
ncbi:MAG: hypothetical protein HY719_09005, partial [Planctomycetes bacterium]|nr:hypothetical protein [Planctomycetota bacterium]